MKYTVILLLFLSFSTNAQWSEFGGMVGLSNYQGELSPDEFQEYLSESSLSLGAFYRLNFNPYFSLKTSFNYAKVKGADARLNNTELQRRNLSFASNIYELGVTAEYNIFGFDPIYSNKLITPYLFAGVAGFYFNPKALYEGEWVELQPLGTEGQGAEGRGEKYNRFAVAFPYGFGLKWAVNDKWNIGFEVGSRYTLTDYLDDVNGTYMNYNELLLSNGPIAAALGDRSGELLGGEPTIRQTGAVRGNEDVVDFYFIGGVTISYIMDSNPFDGKNRKGHKGAQGCFEF